MVAFDDIVRGRVEIDVSNLGGDFVIVRGDGSPLYHFTVVVDDAAMEMTDVIRGEDHLSNTPKHILLFRALGHAVPRFAHLPLILNPDRTKMSKRKSQTAVSDYIAEGFIREALVNYLALLGWATGTEEEILSIDEIVERFDLSAVHKGGAVFDRERLEWLNGQWIRRLEPDDLVERLRPFVAAELAAGRIDWMPSDDELRVLLPIVSERLPTLGAIGDLVGFLWVRDLEVDPATLVPEALGCGHHARGAHRGPRGHRRHGRRLVRGRRARTAASRARRGARLEGRRPVHGDPCRGHRPDRDAAAVRYARRARSRADAGAGGARRRRPRRRECAPMIHADVQVWLDRYVAAWSSYDAAAIGELFSEDAEYRYQPWARPDRRP